MICCCIGKKAASTLALKKHYHETPLTGIYTTTNRI
jgi:hypothetical protein